MISRFFSWLASFFRASQPRLDLWVPRERLIFAYFDGGKIVSDDPLEIWRRLAEVGPELAQDIEVGRCQKVEWALPAQDEIAAKLRNIFGVKTVKEGGLGRVELAELFDRFMLYTSELKKNSSLTATLPTATSASTLNSPATNRPIPSSLASGSAANEPTTGKAVS